ncbi:MAG: riboflavin synthase [Rickettsiales bacterium]|nr:riboflavin synthase [Rickettsiales bacterium]|tara:strand:+ start:40659 stop:41246 length:588 start_codon:yes stop_codon:yes gene_type:complete
MFTGIIKNFGSIEKIDSSKSWNIKIKSDFVTDIHLGDSISCSGVCLTVFDIDENSFWVNASVETLNKTNLKFLKIGDLINLEKSMKVGDEIGGHLVYGHVDGLSEVKKIIKSKDSHVIDIEIESALLKFLASKCSITLDGISLTVNSISKNIFSINIIPYTWDNTSLKNVKVGTRLNTEIDMLARYVYKAVENLK